MTGCLRVVTSPSAGIARSCHITKALEAKNELRKFGQPCVGRVALKTLAARLGSNRCAKNREAICLRCLAFVLQRWGNNERVLQLSTNIRSGEDAWWNEVLEQCRLGALSDDNYNWMHGFPAKTSISAAQHPFWYEFRKASEPPCTNLACGNACEACRNELARRNLLFAADRLPEGFEEAMLITPHNQAVLQYALRRARDFAKRRGEQLMWCVLH